MFTGHRSSQLVELARSLIAGKAFLEMRREGAFTVAAPTDIEKYNLPLLQAFNEVEI
jgi:hypothetical protein